MTTQTADRTQAAGRSEPPPTTQLRSRHLLGIEGLTAALVVVLTMLLGRSAPFAFDRVSLGTGRTAAVA